jgi:hypothetical protein
VRQSRSGCSGPKAGLSSMTRRSACAAALGTVSLALVASPGLGVAATSQPSISASVKPVPVGPSGSPNTELAGVSCVTSTFCVAVGTYRPGAAFASYQGEHPVLLKFDGHKWSDMTAPTPRNAELNGVDCLARSSCVAVGEQIAADGSTSPLVEELKGNLWSVTSLPAPAIFTVNSVELHGVSCGSAGRCTAAGWDRGVGYAQAISPVTGLIAQEEAGKWSVQPVAPLVPTPEASALGSVVVPSNGFDPSYLMSVSCTTSAQCVAVGQGRTFVQSSAGWSPLAATQLVLNGVSCVSGESCTAVGRAGQGQAGPVVIPTSTAIANLAGTTWRRVPSPNANSPTNELNEVACGAARSCVAVGSITGSLYGGNVHQGVLVEVESDGRWSLARPLRTPPRVDDSLVSVSCPTRATCVAVGHSAINALNMPTGPIHALSVLITH